MEDLFRHRLVEIRTFEIFQIDQCLSKEHGVAACRFLLLMIERVLQLFIADQSLLNEIFPHARDKHFRRETFRFGHDYPCKTHSPFTIVAEDWSVSKSFGSQVKGSLSSTIKSAR